MIDLYTLDLDPFIPRMPWKGAHLQTLRNTLVAPVYPLTDYPAFPLSFKPEDGSGDTLIGLLNVAPHGAKKPLIVLLHGLGGCADSTYMQDAALVLLKAGYNVLRLNLRGAGASAPLCRQHYFAGRSYDLRLVLPLIAPELTRQGIILAGFSLGANLLLKFMGEGATPGVRGAAAFAAPLDLAACARTLDAPHNALYRAYILRQLRREVAATPATLTPEMRAAAMAARKLWDFDDAYTAPRNGFRSAADLYAASSANLFIAGLRLPTLVAYARNDPWIPPQSYDAVAWHATPMVRLVSTTGGGHMGWHQRGGGTWSAQTLLKFADFLSAN